MKLSYKLTPYSIGSLGEMWTISWPLMLGLLSGSFMMFADRLLLSHYSIEALNAAAIAGIASYILMIIPLITAAISEVLVGRSHGAGEIKDMGKPVWQMLWLSALTTPFFLLGAEFLPPFFFQGTGNELLESIYFSWMIYFAPAFCSTLALIGFFVGMGEVRIVTICSILGNLVNIGLDLVLIFGYGPFPEMGIKGAALATGLSQVIQTFFLLSLFLKKSYRHRYGTNQWQFNSRCFIETIRIGIPAGFCRFFEVIAHFLFFRIVILSGSDNLTIITIVQSFCILMGFIVEGLSKGVTSIIANLIGGGQISFVKQVIWSAKKLHLIIFCLWTVLLLCFSKFLLLAFFSEADIHLLQNPHFLSSLYWCLFWMSIFFLFDGFGWIYVGLLTAGGDTKFLLYVGLVLNWAGYVLPSYLLLVVAQGNASQGWMLIAFYAFAAFLIYRYRYRSGQWLASSVRSQEGQAVMIN